MVTQIMTIQGTPRAQRSREVLLCPLERQPTGSHPQLLTGPWSAFPLPPGNEDQCHPTRRGSIQFLTFHQNPAGQRVLNNHHNQLWPRNLGRHAGTNSKSLTHKLQTPFFREIRRQHSSIKKKKRKEKKCHLMLNGG